LLKRNNHAEPNPCQNRFLLGTGRRRLASSNSRESLGSRLGQGRYRIDNIPFYVLGISDGDLIAAVTEEDGRLVFSELVEASSNSTFRLIVSDEEKTSEVRTMFRDRGCPSELVSHGLISLHIPQSVAMRPIAALIEQGEKDGRWGFEEGALRHPDSGFSFLPQ
jgi:Domain of unknown function (DUF4265)